MGIDERRVRLEAKGSETALNVLRSMGFSPEYNSSEKVVTFIHGGNTIRYFSVYGLGHRKRNTRRTRVC